jgi:hypothetical protein
MKTIGTRLMPTLVLRRTLVKISTSELAMKIKILLGRGACFPTAAAREIEAPTTLQTFASVLL